MTKVRYEIDLAELRPVEPLDGMVRNVAHEDLEVLAQLMLDAYRGTIDYEDEDYEDALVEVRSFLEGKPALEFSSILELSKRLELSCRCLKNGARIMTASKLFTFIYFSNYLTFKSTNIGYLSRVF